MDTTSIKQRFGIITNDSAMNRAIEIAMQVAATDLSVLITGESGVGKEFFPKIIHYNSQRKHGPYIAINCGAIPEGTIDSELFGHEKGSFTDAKEARKGYFEVASGGTLFLDEVAELPLATQVRLLRVLETGEFIKVGSSKSQKTDVRVVAATNVDIPAAITRGKFREDLYYRLNTIAILVPALRDRKEDIELLFRKFATDMSEKYRVPILQLKPDAKQALLHYAWQGNVRQLKNITEQISIVEPERHLSAEVLRKYLPPERHFYPVLSGIDTKQGMSERDILYSVLFDMKRDITELKKVIAGMLKGNVPVREALFDKPALSTADKMFFHEEQDVTVASDPMPFVPDAELPVDADDDASFQDAQETSEDSLSLDKQELSTIQKALEKYKGKRRLAAQELGISERTLYRKIKDFGLDYL